MWFPIRKISPDDWNRILCLDTQFVGKSLFLNHMVWDLAIVDRFSVPKKISQGVVGADPTFLLLLGKHLPFA